MAEKVGENVEVPIVAIIVEAGTSQRAVFQSKKRSVLKEMSPPPRLCF